MAEEYPFWDSMKERFEDISPLVLVLLVVYLYNSFISTILPKPWKMVVFYTIITYFVLELAVKYLACRDPKYFVYNYWLDILLVIPFFKSLKLFGAIGKALKSIKTVKFLKFLPYTRKAIKVPKMLKKSQSSLKRQKEKLKSLLE